MPNPNIHKVSYYPKFFGITRTTTSTLTLSFLYDLAKEKGSNSFYVTYRHLVENLGINQSMARGAILNFKTSPFLTITVNATKEGHYFQLALSKLDALLGGEGNGL